MKEDQTAPSPLGSPVQADGPSNSIPKRPSEVAEADEPRRIGLVYLSLLALGVGIAAGLGAIVFRELIGLIYNLLFLGQFSSHYDTEVFTPASPWGAFIILAPAVGSVAVTFLVTKFAPEAKGHGCRKSWTRSTTGAASSVLWWRR